MRSEGALVAGIASTARDMRQAPIGLSLRSPPLQWINGRYRLYCWISRDGSFWLEPCFVNSSILAFSTELRRGLPVVQWLQLQKCLAVTLQSVFLTISGVTYSNITVGTFHAAPGRARKAAAAARHDRLRALINIARHCWSVIKNRRRLHRQLATLRLKYTDCDRTTRRKIFCYLYPCINCLSLISRIYIKWRMIEK